MFRFCRKKGQFYQNYPVLWAKKVNRYPFFPDLKKNYCSHVHILLKNVQSLNNLTHPCRYNIRKTSNLSKTRCAYVNFFKFFMKNPLLSYPYLVKKTSILSKLHYIFSFAKKIRRMPFFPDFHKTCLLSGPYFIKKVHYLKTTLLSCAYFVKKTSILPKTDALMSFYFQFFLENPPAVIPIFGQKPVKTTLCYGQQSQQDVLFSDLRRKNHTSYAHIL